MPLIHRCLESHALVIRVIDGYGLARRLIEIRLRLASDGGRRRRLLRKGRVRVESEVQRLLLSHSFLFLLLNALLFELVGNVLLEVAERARSSPINAHVLIDVDHVLRFIFCIVIRPALWHPIYSLAGPSYQF